MNQTVWSFSDKVTWFSKCQTFKLEGTIFDPVKLLNEVKHVTWRDVWLHRCWWWILETKCVGIQKMSPIYKFRHQHAQIVANIKSPSSLVNTICVVTMNVFTISIFWLSVRDFLSDEWIIDPYLNWTNLLSDPNPSEIWPKVFQSRDHFWQNVSGSKLLGYASAEQFRRNCNLDFFTMGCIIENIDSCGEVLSQNKIIFRLLIS